MTDDQSPLAVRVSRQLAEASRLVAALPDQTAKAVLARRLIAITNVAKHDIEVAARRLDTLLADLGDGAETSET